MIILCKEFEYEYWQQTIITQIQEEKTNMTVYSTYRREYLHQNTRVGIRHEWLITNDAEHNGQ